VGPDLAFTDAYATSAFAMGREALDWVGSLAGYDALLITEDGRAISTPGFEALRLS
jgi:thiamine biosynthesis lipoprotein